MDLSPERLEYYLFLIEKNLSFKRILKEESVGRYYQKTAWAYSRFHDKGGALHMAINPGGVFDKKGYKGQAARIDEYITAKMDVLELGAGRAYNTEILCKSNPESLFVATDGASRQVDFCRQRLSGYKNAFVQQMNYEDIYLKNNSFDLVFAVETLCHAKDISKVFRQLKNILKKNGRVIIFDAWLMPGVFLGDLGKAFDLTTKSMAISDPLEYSLVFQKANDFFEIERVDNLSKYIMPSLFRLHDLSWRFIKRPRFSRLASFIAPDVSQNAIAGLLMPYLVEMGMVEYQMVVLKNKTTVN